MGYGFAPGSDIMWAREGSLSCTSQRFVTSALRVLRLVHDQPQKSLHKKVPCSALKKNTRGLVNDVWFVNLCHASGNGTQLLVFVTPWTKTSVTIQVFCLGTRNWPHLSVGFLPNLNLGEGLAPIPQKHSGEPFNWKLRPTLQLISGQLAPFTPKKRSYEVLALKVIWINVTKNF